MQCKNCGTILDDGAQFCPQCGTKAEPPEPSAVPGSETPHHFCPTCGKKLDSGMKFCPACGSAVDNITPVVIIPPKQNPPPKKPKLKLKISKKILFSALAVILVAALAVVLISGFSGSGSGLAKTTSYVFDTEEETLLLYGSKVVTVSDESYYSDADYSPDRSSAVVLVSEEDEQELYLCSGGKATRIADEVVVFTSSADCSKVAYLAGDYDDGYDLYLYNGKKSEKIASGVTSSIVISPDGSAVGYSTCDDDGDVKGYIYDGKEQELGKDKTPIAVSNNAKYIYYYKGDSSYAQKGIDADDKVKLGSGQSFYFNEDLSECVFWDDDSTYLLTDCEEKTKLSSDSFYPYNSIYSTLAYSRSGYSVILCSSFQGRLFSAWNDSAYKVSRLTKKLELTTVCKCDDFWLSTDDHTMIYQKGSKIYTINASKEDAEGKLLVEDVDYTLFADQTLDCVYYVDDDDTLCCINARGKVQDIADWDDVEDWSLLSCETLYYTSDGELYRWNGSKSELLKGAGDEVEEIYSYLNYLIVETEDSILYTIDGKTFTELYEY